MSILKDYSVTSFFCGCGGLDLGFRGDFVYHNKAYEKLRNDVDQCVASIIEHTHITLETTATEVL